MKHFCNPVVNRLRTSRHPLGIQEVRSIITPCGGNYDALYNLSPISKEHRCVSTSTFFFLALCLSSQVSTKDRVKLKQREKKSALTLCPFIPGSPGVPGNPRAPCKSNKEHIKYFTSANPSLAYIYLWLSWCKSLT